MVRLSLGLLLAALLSRVDAEAGHLKFTRPSSHSWSLHRLEANPTLKLGFLSAAPGVMREGEFIKGPFFEPESGALVPGHGYIILVAKIKT